MDGRLILGIGIGMVITCILLLPLYHGSYSPSEIEKKAKEMGMVYPDEVKVLTKEREGK